MGYSGYNRDESMPPLIAHVVHRFDYGGLENGLVNLINNLPMGSFRHGVISMTEATGFAERLERRDVRVYSLYKKAGQDPRAYVRFFKLLVQLRPTLLHTRNWGTLDCVPIARLAGVPFCVHGEHGWDMHDPDGTSSKQRWLRRCMNPLVTQFITVSNELRDWLRRVGIKAEKITRIYNGVDTQSFVPRTSTGGATTVSPLETVVVGSVMRFSEIKDPMNLVKAFIIARPLAEVRGIDLRLSMIGDGPLRPAALGVLERADLASAAWLPGKRDDIAKQLQRIDMFVLPSRREGISNTLLEAMACGLPLIATDTGGNPELFLGAEVGRLVPPSDSRALAEALLEVAFDSGARSRFGAAARQQAVSKFGLQKMVSQYQNMYCTVLEG